MVTKREARHRKLVNLAERPGTPAEGRVAKAKAEQVKNTLPAVRERFSQKTIHLLPLPPGGRASHVLYDTPPPPTARGQKYTRGFGICITAKGVRSYIFNYRVRKTGIERRMTIERCDRMSLEQARHEAEQLSAAVGAGRDPLQEREEARRAAEARREAGNVNELCDQYLEACRDKSRRPGTLQQYEILIETYIRPALGTMKVADVRLEDIERLHSTVGKRKNRTGGESHHRANLCHAVVQAMFNLAVKRKMRLDNPAIGVEHFEERPRRRYATDEEVGKLRAVLDAHPNQQAANAIRLLLWTGARSGETLQAKWSDFDLEAGMWRKPYEITKTGEAHDLPLSGDAVAMLKQMKAHAQSGQLFPGLSFAALSRIWRQIREQIGAADLRKHDLRHSFASVAISNGIDLYTVSKLLGHKNIQTTQRYAHLNVEAQKLAADKVAAALNKMAGPTGPTSE